MKFSTLILASIFVGGAFAVEPNARFGIISDIHLDLGCIPLKRVFGDGGHSERVFRTALECLRSRGVDGVVLSGDMTRIGQISELRRVGEIWREVFPNDQRPDGGHVERLFVFGDHEIETFDSKDDGYLKWFINEKLDIEKIRAGDIAENDRAKQWKAAFGEEFAPIRRKTVKGYDFVLANIVTTKEEGLRPGQPLHIPGLEEFFATNHFDAVKPFFYVQHKIPRGTVGGPYQSGQDSGRTTAVLSRYPNAVGFCGHKHRTATEELSLWQGAFTQVQVPALATLLTAAGRENGRCSCEAPLSSPPQQMPQIDTTRDGSQALILSIYTDRLVFERVDVLAGGERVAEPWIVKWPNDGSSAYAARGRVAAVPQFADGAKVKVEKIRGKNRSGAEVDQVRVSFPVVNSRAASPRAYDYEVTAVLLKGVMERVACQKRVYSPKCYRPERFDTNDVICVFSRDELSSNHDEMRFRVRPMNAWGNAGDAIESESSTYWPKGALYPW